MIATATRHNERIPSRQPSRRDGSPGRRVVLALSALLLLGWLLSPAHAEYLPVDLGAACNAYNDAFNASFDPPVPGGLYTYYDDPVVAYNGVPFDINLPSDPPAYNIVSTPIHETAVVSFPIPAANLKSIYFLGVGTWLADYLGHQHLWCDDPGHVWFRVRYEDGSSEDLFPVNVETGLAEWSDILRADGAVATFEAMPIGYVHMYRLSLQDKVATGLELHDNCADPAGQFIVLAMTAETRDTDDVVFSDDFTGTTIDPSKWRVFCRHNYPQFDGSEPWWLYTFWEQDDSLQLRVTHQNLVWVVARSLERFTEACTSYEVDVWQDDVSGWQDWPIIFTTPYGEFGYYNAGGGWTAKWTSGGGENRAAANVFPEAAQPWVHYRLRVSREANQLCWYLDNGDGSGYRLVHSTDDFSFPYVRRGHLIDTAEPIYHIWLASTDLGVTHWDNVAVRGRLQPLREAILFVSDRSGNRDIWMMEADGSNPQQLTANPGVDDMPVPSPPSFFPSESAIAYVSDEGNPVAPPGELPNTAIWVMKPDGSGKRRLTSEETAYCSQPQWSDEACHIVYVKKLDGETPELWRVNVLTGTDQRLTNVGVTHKNPEWCGGYQIVYDKDTGGGGWWELFAVDPNGANPSPLATSHHSISPASSHGGSRPYGGSPTHELAYVRVLTSTSQVRAVRADGSNDRLIHDNSAIAYDGWGQAAWSPDDALLAASIYPSRHPGATEFESFVQIVDPITGAEIYQTTEGRNAFALESSLYNDVTFSAGDRVWNEDGSRLVFMSDRDGDWEIYAMAPDGTGQVNLTEHHGWDGSPCWIALPGEPTGVVQAEIDIKPGSERNPVNPKSQGVLPVAVFSSSTFDATDVDPSTVLLAGAPVAQNPDDGGWMMHEGDENGDGLIDVRLHFETEDIDVELLVDGEYAILTGITFGGIEFMGSDNVTIVPKDLANDHWALEEIAECIEGEIVQGYPDGSYLPEVKVSRAQMAAFVSRAHAGGDNAVPEGPEEATFPDVPTGHWAYDYVEYASANAIVTGYSGGTYQPSWIVNRGQMAVFIARAEDWVSLDDDLATAPELFLDVPAGYWAGKAIEACVSHGVVQGYSDGSYRPTAAVTRDQMAVYIARAFELAT